MVEIITLPGIYGSGSDHWQTRWEASDSRLRRFQPADWDRPELGEWMDVLDREVGASKTPPVLLAHSLACLLVAHWRARSDLPVAGAMLVCVPDPDGPCFPKEAASFAGPPESRFRFPSVTVASANDPFGTPTYSRTRAQQWGSRLIEAGNLGHINGESALGAWPQGRLIFEEFMTDLQSA